MLRRSQLFVPANEEKKIRKSVTLPADTIVLDLEDAVPPGAKSGARDILSKLVKELDWGSRELCVRINKPSENYSQEDLNLVKLFDKIDSIMLPKIEENPSYIFDSSGKELNVQIETARGLSKIAEIASGKGISSISFGPQDFANSVRGNIDAYRTNNFVKTSIVVNARANGLAPIDGVYFELTNLRGFRAESLASKGLGFEGKHVIHPAQIEIANEVFGPSKEEVSAAKKIVELYERASKDNVGALRVDDKLIDAVHYRQAKAILESSDDEQN